MVSIIHEIIINTNNKRILGREIRYGKNWVYFRITLNSCNQFQEESKTPISIRKSIFIHHQNNLYRIELTRMIRKHENMVLKFKKL